MEFGGLMRLWMICFQGGKDHGILSMSWIQMKLHAITIECRTCLKLLIALLIVMLFIVSPSYFIDCFSGLLMNHFDFMTVAFQLWGRVKYDEKEINDFALGLDFALRP